MKTYKTIIRFEQAAEQSDGAISRITGFVPAKHFLGLYDDATLDANPRSAKVGTVTSDIIESVTESPSIFQFKTKGVLIGTSDFDALDRSRFELRFNNPVYEGVLDGGHNMLALGVFLLNHVMDAREIRKIKLWSDLKEAWTAHGDEIRAMRDDFDFKVPVELLVPSDPNDEEVVAEFRLALVEVCAARNNNAQLTSEAKANQRGFYEALRERVPEELARRVEWKSNEWESDDTRPIKVRDIVSLSWLPLTLLAEEDELPLDESGRRFMISPPKLYASKGEASKLFDRLMEHRDVSKAIDGPRHELHHVGVESAFEVTGTLPALYDQVFLGFAEAYNKGTGGKFGRIRAVKVPKRGHIVSPYFATQGEYGVPDGFVLPIIWGLRSIMAVENQLVNWSTDPHAFLERHLEVLVSAFKMPMEMASFDPQKIAKTENSYRFMEGEVEKAWMKDRAGA